MLQVRAVGVAHRLGRAPDCGQPQSNPGERRSPPGRRSSAPGVPPPPGRSWPPAAGIRGCRHPARPRRAPAPPPAARRAPGRSRFKIGDLQLAARRGFQALRQTRPPAVVEINAGHGVVRAWRGRLFFDARARVQSRVELDHPVALRVAHRVGEDQRALASSSLPRRSLPGSPWPKKMLSPRIRHTGSPPMNSRPTRKASASPRGSACSA